MLVAWSVAALAGDPQWFEYEFARKVGRGEGTYAGYTDRLTSNGRYELVTTGDRVAVDAHYTWSYTSSSEPSDRGTTDRNTSYDRRMFRYDGDKLDLDDPEWTAVDVTTLAPWFAIGTPVRVGDEVRLLDVPCRVEAIDEPMQLPDGSHATIRCESSGSGKRNDSYGTMDTTWTETSWFDAATGLIVRQEREERDQGMIGGETGSFVMTEELTLTDASYAPLPPPPAWAVAVTLITMAIMFAAPMFAPLLFIAFVVAFIWFVRKMMSPPTRVKSASHGDVDLAQAKSALELARFPNPVATATFAPFLEDFARKALASGDKVVLATSKDALVGVGLSDRETSLGTVFTADTAVAKGLLRWIGGEEFFTETRHKDGARDAFNVYETFKVMRLSALPEVAYDTALVQQAAPNDSGAIEACLKAVYPKVPVARWLLTTLQSSDLVFVARVDNAVVGVGVATLCGTSGRLHALAVNPKHRDRGIAKELVRARLAALKALGATDVISEISETAPASLHIARELGFTEIGTMLVETTETVRVERPVLRR